MKEFFTKLLEKELVLVLAILVVLSLVAYAAYAGYLDAGMLTETTSAGGSSLETSVE